MGAPIFAITIPRPWVWLVARGFKRDFLLDATDPTFLVDQVVALHSASGGDAKGWVHFDRWSDGTVGRKQVANEAPHNAVVGVAKVIRVDRFESSWRIAFAECRPVVAIGAIEAGECEFWPIPARVRAELARREAA